jgi:hypothetical protein
MWGRVPSPVHAERSSAERLCGPEFLTGTLFEMKHGFHDVGPIRDIAIIAAGKAIRERKRLWKAYGKGRWRKLKGIATIKFSDGATCQAEIHWYEAHGIGAKEHKIKRIVD